jgi:hypothetical protein
MKETTKNILYSVRRIIDDNLPKGFKVVSMTYSDKGFAYRVQKKAGQNLGIRFTQSMIAKEHSEYEIAKAVEDLVEKINDLEG